MQYSADWLLWRTHDLTDAAKVINAGISRSYIVNSFNFKRLLFEAVAELRLPVLKN